jgi:N-acylglucosamine 2-epimerase
MYAQAAELIPAVRELDPDYLGWLVTAFDHLCGLGWDAENGGLFRFVDRDGGPPKGASGGSTYEAMVKASWDWKLWWPHNEALYAGLLLWVRTGSANMATWYRRMDDYTFSHFPAGPGREWSQILDRKGRPMDPDPRAALPVKDPYHLMRSLILLIALSDANMPIIRKDQQ